MPKNGSRLCTLLEVLQHLTLNGVCATPRVEACRDWQLRMNVREIPAEAAKSARLNLRGRQQLIEFFLAAELVHEHRVLNDRAVPADPGLAIACGDFAHLQVQIWSESSVEPYFLRAAKCAMLRGAQVDECIVHRPLDLVRKLTRQQHPRDVSLDELDRIDAVRIRLRRQQRFEMDRQRAAHKEPAHRLTTSRRVADSKLLCTRVRRTTLRQALVLVDLVTLWLRSQARFPLFTSQPMPRSGRQLGRGCALCS